MAAVVATAVPLQASQGNEPFTFDEAVGLLKGSTSAHFAGYVSFAVSIVTLLINLNLLNDGSGSSEAGTTSACIADGALYVASACTFATGQVIPLAKITRDRFVASLHGVAGAPTGLRALKGTTESYLTALVFFVVSIGFCIHSIGYVASNTDETIALTLSFFFLVCSASWVCKSTRDRSDVENELWERSEEMTPVILRLARGTGTNVRLCVVAWVGSILLTFICIWKSTNENFDSSLKLLLSMGEIFQVISAFWMAKTVRDSLVPGVVTQSTWLLAAGGGAAALLFTYAGLFLKWSALGTSLGITLWTALSFSLFSSFFLLALILALVACSPSWCVTIKSSRNEAGKSHFGELCAEKLK